ncbi:hypothetical protein ACP3WJ_23450, partial [Salmonella enterica]
LRIFIAGLASALLLTACERSGDSGSAATATAAAEPVVLTALVWAPDWSEEMHRVADAFSLKHPEVRINLQFMIGNSVEENLKPRAATD